MTRSRNHTFVGTDIDLIDGNKLTISMNNYIQESIYLFDENINKKVWSVVNKNLHKVNPDSPILPKKQAEDFYSIVENILWTTKRS